MKPESSKRFEKLAAENTGGSFLGDLWGFLKMNKKWWLVPILVVFLLFAILILLSSTGVAPFIYTLW